MGDRQGALGPIHCWNLRLPRSHLNIINRGAITTEAYIYFIFRLLVMGLILSQCLNSSFSLVTVTENRGIEIR